LCSEDCKESRVLRSAVVHADSASDRWPLLLPRKQIVVG
jgi:hypothetical protein